MNNDMISKIKWMYDEELSSLDSLHFIHGVI